MNGHWTSRSTADFVHKISTDFAFQIENKMDGEPITQSDLAKRLGVSEGRVSQVLRNPGNLTLKNMVEYAKALGLKVAVVAYDDDDPLNKNGPINSQIFTACWDRIGRPNDFFALRESASTILTAPPIQYLAPSISVGQFQTNSDWSTLTDLGLIYRIKTTPNFLIETGV